MPGNFATQNSMTKHLHSPMSLDSKVAVETKEDIETSTGNLEYNNDDEEPEIHFRTWIAIAALCVSAFA